MEILENRLSNLTQVKVVIISGINYLFRGYFNILRRISEIKQLLSRTKPLIFITYNYDGRFQLESGKILPNSGIVLISIKDDERFVEYTLMRHPYLLEKRLRKWKPREPKKKPPFPSSPRKNLEWWLGGNPKKGERLTISQVRNFLLAYAESITKEISILIEKTPISEINNGSLLKTIEGITQDRYIKKVNQVSYPEEIQQKFQQYSEIIYKAVKELFEEKTQGDIKDPQFLKKIEDTIRGYYHAELLKYEFFWSF